MHPHHLPKYVMNALTSLEEVGRPIEIESIIRILKSQYNKRKMQSISQEEQGFMGKSLKKCIYEPTARNRDILLRPVGLKVVLKKAKDLNRRRDPNLRRKRENKRQMQPKKAPAM